MSLPNPRVLMTGDGGMRLSPAGEARRRNMLESLQREVATRGRRRRAAMGAIVGVPVIALVIAGGLLLRSMSVSGRVVPVAPIAEGGLPTGTPGPACVVVDTGGGSLEAAPDVSPSSAPRSVIVSASPAPGWDGVPLAQPVESSLIRPARGSADLLDRSRYRGRAIIPEASDAELAVGLRAAGRAAGIVRTPGGVMILPDRPTQPG